MTTKTARFTSNCRKCSGTIRPGDGIVVLGKGRTVHANCEASGGVVEFYFPSTGNYAYRNRAGRCEDAPCCGCCTF